MSATDDIERVTELLLKYLALEKEVKRLRGRLRDATDLLYDCEYYICPTCNEWADRNYDCENCKEADE